MLAPAKAAISPTGKTVLFNGRDLSGWYEDIPARDTDAGAPPIVVIDNGVLRSQGESVGHLVSEQAFENFRFEVDYRLPPAGGGGSVLVHVSTLRVLRTKSKNVFPRSLDIKIRHRDVGDIYCIEENLDCPDPARRPLEPGQVPGGRPEDGRHIVKIRDAENPIGQWNTITVECSGRNVRVFVNGTLVNEGTNGTAKAGRVALQITEQQVEFRRVEIFPIERS
jgi:hypothetical protein